MRTRVGVGKLIERAAENFASSLSVITSFCPPLLPIRPSSQFVFGSSDAAFDRLPAGKKRDDEEGAKKNPPLFWEMPLYRTFRKLSCCSPNHPSPIPHFRSFHFCGICGKGPTILFPDLSKKTDRFRPQRVEEKNGEYK